MKLTDATPGTLIRRTDDASDCCPEGMTFFVGKPDTFHAGPYVVCSAGVVHCLDGDVDENGTLLGWEVATTETKGTP